MTASFAFLQHTKNGEKILEKHVRLDNWNLFAENANDEMHNSNYFLITILYRFRLCHFLWRLSIKLLMHIFNSLS